MENTQKIIDCQTFEELYSLLKDMKTIEGSSQDFTAEEMINRINLVRSGSPSNYVTRTHGLRAKVLELMQYKDA